MQSILPRLLCALLACTCVPSYAQITIPYLYHSNANNFSGTGIAADEYRGTLGVKSHRFTFQANFTGNNFYKINNVADNTDNNFNSPAGSKVWSGSLSLNTQGTAFAYGDGNGGAGSSPVTSGKSYTYIWQDVNTSSDAQAIVMETDNSPVSITSVSATPMVPTPSQAVTVTVTLSAAPSPQEKVYLRYSTNGFTTYGTLLSPTTGAGTATQTFTIPAQPNNTSVSYYVFTTTLSSGSLTNNAFLTDLATIFFNNNNGSNFAYTSLPIELTAFGAEKIARTVRLTWTTATEQNNDRFEVERSSDGTLWSLLTTVPTQNGNARYPQTYDVTDQFPRPARNYYRLRQVDTNGKSAYSAVRTVEMERGAVATIAPNPVENGTLQLSLPAGITDAHVRLFDAQGRLLRSWKFDTEAEVTVPLELTGIAGGMLFLQVNGDTPLRIVKR